MKAWIKKVFGFGLASLLSDFSHEMTISFIPILVAQFVGPALAPFYLGIIASLTDSFASFLRIFSGYISDILSHKKPLIALGYGMSALFSMLVGFAHSVWGILFYRMLSFSGSGLREPPRDAVIVTTVKPIDYGRAIGLRNALDTIGSLIGPLVAFACIGFVSIKGIFLLSFIPGFFSVAAILFLTKDIHVPPLKKEHFLSFWKKVSLLPHRFIIFLLIVFILDLATINKLLLFSRTQEILIDTQPITKYLIFLYAIFNVSRACGALLIGWISDHLNRILLLAFIGCGFYALVAFLLINAHASLWYCIGIFILNGIGTAAVFTLKKACAADMLPAGMRGLGYGTLQASEGFAALFANVFIGFVWTHFSATLSFSYVIAMSIISMILLLIFATIQMKHYNAL